jgi:phenylacetaldehyde dehydrogenase
MMATAAEKMPGDGQARAFLARQHKLLIDGKWVSALSGKTFPVTDPSTEEVISHVAEGDAADIDAAVRAARRAFEGVWAKTLPSERAKILWRWADLIEQNAAEIAMIESFNVGKPYAAALRLDITETSERLRYFAGWCTKLSGATLSGQGPENWHGYTLREPVGVVGAITAWNFAMAQAANKLAAAFAAGCTVVLKPPEITPLSTLRFAELGMEAGLPDGVLNVVPGFGRTAGAALGSHMDVDKISFTGSTATGKQLIDLSRSNLKRLTLELGGKSPFLIFGDADLDKAIPTAAASIFFNAGQVCTAGSRLFVHASVFDRVVAGISDYASRLKIGPGTESGNDLGPIISSAQLDKVLSYCNSAARQARVIRGGRRVERKGYFVEPTVVTETSPEMNFRREEIFGPVLCAVPFEDENGRGRPLILAARTLGLPRSVRHDRFPQTGARSPLANASYDTATASSYVRERGHCGDKVLFLAGHRASTAGNTPIFPVMESGKIVYTLVASRRGKESFSRPHESTGAYFAIKRVKNVRARLASRTRLMRPKSTTERNETDVSHSI